MASIENGYSNGHVEKNGATWRACVTKYKNGRSRRITHTTGVPCKSTGNYGKQTAERVMHAWLDSLKEQDRTLTAETAETSLADYCNAYVELLGQTRVIEPSTVRDYKKSLRHLGFIADIPLCSVTKTEIEQWELSLLSSGLSAVSVGKCHRILKQCFKHATETGDASYSPMVGIKPPKRPQPQPNALTAQNRSNLVRILKEMQPSPIRTAAALALFAGMRQGEICALRWANVDLESAVINVVEAIGQAEGGSYLKEPKTHGSRRTIPMTKQLLEMVRERRHAMLEECDAAGTLLKPDMFVIGHTDGTYQSPPLLGKEWAGLASSYALTGVTGKRITFHDLRHSFATVAITEGVDVKTVSSILGHSNAAMTLNVYTASDPNAKLMAASIIGNAFEG